MISAFSPLIMVDRSTTYRWHPDVVLKLDWQENDHTRRVTILFLLLHYKIYNGSIQNLCRFVLEEYWRIFLINIDESGFYLNSCVKNYGRSHKTICVIHPSHYSRAEPKVNLIMTVEPGNTNLPPHVLGVPTALADGYIFNRIMWISSYLVIFSIISWQTSKHHLYPVILMITDE